MQEILEHSIPKLELRLGLFDSKCEIAENLVDKVKAFNDAMSSETPTALTWLQGPTGHIDNHTDHKKVMDSLRKV